MFSRELRKVVVNHPFLLLDELQQSQLGIELSVGGKTGCLLLWMILYVRDR